MMCGLSMLFVHVEGSWVGCRQTLKLIMIQHNYYTSLHSYSLW